MRQFNSLNQLPILQNLSAHQQNATLAQQVWEAITPDNLATVSKAVSIKHQTLHIVTQHNAVAAKIKFLTPSLLEQLESVEIEVTAIQVKVQVKSSKPEQPKVHKKVSQKAAQNLQKLANTLEDGSLKQALARIASHANKP